VSEVVIDASVAICWFVRESATENANGLIAATTNLVAPSLMLAELANALWKKTRRGEIRADLAEAGMREIRRFVPQIVELPDLIRPAFALAHELGHPVYDCIYLALARRRDAPFVTLDRVMMERLAGTRYASDAVLLADWQGN
jgi:predicted nucleic acid-binding protein